MKSLYEVVTTNKPPESVHRAGTAVYEAMDSVAKKLKKKKKRTEVVAKNALSEDV
jgi:hypothetical protein